MSSESWCSTGLTEARGWDSVLVALVVESWVQPPSRSHSLSPGGGAATVIVSYGRDTVVVRRSLSATGSCSGSYQVVQDAVPIALSSGNGSDSALVIFKVKCGRSL